MSNQLTPFPHQLDTITELDKQFKENNNKALVVLPSGSGKTHTVAFHVARLKPKSFLYVVHRNVINEQTVNIFKEICNLQDSDIGVIDQYNKEFNRKYLFATIQTLFREQNLQNVSKNIEYMVIDEFHHVAATSYDKILVKHFKPKYLVGLTATPYRLDNRNILKYIDNNIAINIDLFEGIKRNILAPFNYMGLWDNIDYSEIKFSGYQYNVTDLDRQLVIHKRDEQVINEYKKHVLPEKRLTIGFCNSVEHVDRLVKKFNKEGIKAIGITYKENFEVREEILTKFKNGYYQVLLTRDILNEGVDFPECSALLFLRPTISKTIFFQQLGRGLRKHKSKKDVLVLDYIGNYHRAFEKREWLRVFKHGTTGQNIKPYYEYSPNIRIQFAPEIVTMMNIQERFMGGQVTKAMLKQDYLNCCKLENKKQLRASEYEASKNRRCSYRSVFTLFGGFSNFIRDSNISYEDNRIGPIGWMACRDKKLLTENYYEVQKKWLATGKRNRYINTQERCPPSTEIDNPKISKYGTYCYRKVWGTYRKFLLSIGELKNRPEIVIYDTKEVKEQKIKLLIKALQKKVNREYFSLTEWRKEYGGLVKTDIEKMGFDKFREKYNVPISYIRNCSVCGKQYSSQYIKLKWNVCSDNCRNKISWLKKYRPLKQLERQEKLKEVMTCLFCGKIVNKYNLNAEGNLQPKTKFCSKACNGKYKYYTSKNTQKVKKEFNNNGNDPVIFMEDDN